MNSPEYEKEVLKTYPFLKAGKGIWIDSNEKEFEISDKYGFDNSHLRGAFLLVKKECKRYSEQDGDTEKKLYKLFNSKFKQLKAEVKARGLDLD